MSSTEIQNYNGLLDWVKEKLKELKNNLFGERYITRFEKVEPLRCPGCFRCFDKVLNRWINCNFDTPLSGYTLSVKDGYLVVVHRIGKKIYYYRVPEKYCRGKIVRGRTLAGCVIYLKPTIISPKNLYLVEDGKSIVYKSPEPKISHQTDETHQVSSNRQVYTTTTTTATIKPVFLPPQPSKEESRPTASISRQSQQSQQNDNKFVYILLGLGLVAIILTSRR